MKKAGRMRMQSKIFRGSLLTTLVAAILCAGICVGYSYYSISLESRKNLRAEARNIAWAVELGGQEYLRGVEPEPKSRITWISPQGEVLFDTDVQPERLDNHKKRDEVLKALETGYGESVRHSNTLDRQTLNYAVRIADGSVVRFSVETDTILAVLQGAVPSILMSLALVSVLALAMAAWTSRRIVEPINRIDLQQPGKGRTYEELEPLVRRIGSQNQQLQEQMDRLTREHEKQDKFRREFTANVSHELKTPLTSISGFAEIIRDGLVRPEDVSRFAGNIYKEAQRLIILVGDIIKISRMDDKQIPVQREQLDLCQLCEDVMEHLAPAADRAGVKLTMEAEEKVPRILGARQIADEMIYNLCDNAIKYNHPGGTVKIRLRRQGENQVMLQVEDTGIGIPLEHQDRVFERFYRVDKTRSKAMGGTGLGLSIVKHGALFHEAALDLASAPGKGTTITVVFPIKPKKE